MCDTGLDAQSILQKFGKGKPIPAIIESVSGGANLKATLLPDQYFVNINLVGVSCPSMNRRPQGTGPSPAPPAANGDAPAAAAEAAEGKNSTAGTSSAQCSHCRHMVHVTECTDTYAGGGVSLRVQKSSHHAHTCIVFKRL